MPTFILFYKLFIIVNFYLLFVIFKILAQIYLISINLLYFFITHK
jgi:hypothetical protein